MKPKSLTLAKKAALGAAASSVVFGLQHQADAAVVYTNPTDINVTIRPGVIGNSLANVDIDGVGYHEFNVLVHRYNAGSGVNGVARLAGIGPGYSFLLNGSSQIKKLTSGAVVASANIFRSTGSLRKFVNGVPAAGTWENNSTGFAGVRFLAGGNLHYGWIRMKWTDDSGDADGDPNTITLMDWAYNDTPDGSILAGEGAAVPEPSRALLALAGLGGMALRRRRKAAA